MTDDEIRRLLEIWDRRTLSERDMNLYEIASYEDAPSLAAEVLALRDVKQSVVVLRLRAALQGVLQQYEDVRDCIDNDGKPYQSQAAADAITAARAALEGK